MPTPSNSTPVSSQNDNNKKKDEKEEHFTGFDPRGLERAAVAAKELEKSPLGKEAIQLQREEEKTKQAKLQSELEENKARQQAYAVERARVEAEERRKTIDMEHQSAQQQQQYQDQLSRKRHQDQLQAQQAMRSQEMKRQEESAMRIEQLKRETAQYEAQLRKETDEAKVLAETKGRIQQERQNFDLILERSKVEAKEFRTTVLNGIREAGVIVGEGAKAYIQDWQKITSTVAGLSLLALGVYGARVSTQVAGRYVEARLGRPPLVRETSRRTLATFLRHPIAGVKDLLTSSSPNAALEGVVLEPSLKGRLGNLAVATTNTKKNNAPFRHVLLYGPPGTGKTLFAKKLAKASGMDYAVMTGGDVAPLGREAVTEIHKLFDWSSASSRGLLIFVDEADAFLRKRTNETMSEDARNALNAFLYRTGTESRNFMLVFASNIPGQLDFAVTDRTDEAVEFNLPGLPERVELMKLYFEKFIQRSGEGGSMFRSSTKIKVDPEVNWDQKLSEIAKKLEGFSGREISKVCVALQAAAYGTENAALDSKMVDSVINDKIRDHKEKIKWRIGSEKIGSD
jgi:ATPase family AAA domain-containing protein 3A/B